MQLKSPPMQPESCLFRSSCGRDTAENSSLLALHKESDPEGKYRLARVTEPMSKTIALPRVSTWMFSGEKSDLRMVAVPYLLVALFE